MGFVPHAERQAADIPAETRQILTWVALLGTLLFWASSFAGIEVALESYSAAQLAVLRYIIASIALIIYAVIRRMPLPPLREVPSIFVVGFIGFTLYNITLNAGQQFVSAGAASFIISSEVAVIALLASVFFKERLDAMGWLGILICVVGVGIISSTAEGGFSITWGAFYIFVAMLCMSLYSVMQKPFLKRYDAIQFTTYAIWGGTVCLLPFAPDAFNALPQATSQANFSLVYLGIFPGVVAYIAWSYVLANMPAARAGSFLATIPAAAVVIAWLWLSEIPHPLGLMGGTVVVLGALIVNNRNCAQNRLDET